MAVTRYVASALHLGGQTAVLAFLVSGGRDLKLIDAI
jgi:hypothetical protein